MKTGFRYLAQSIKIKFETHLDPQHFVFDSLTHTHTHTHTHIYIHTYTHTHTHTHIYIYIHTYTHTHMHIYHLCHYLLVSIFGCLSLSGSACLSVCLSVCLCVCLCYSCDDAVAGSRPVPGRTAELREVRAQHVHGVLAVGAHQLRALLRFLRQ